MTLAYGCSTPQLALTAAASRREGLSRSLLGSVRRSRRSSASPISIGVCRPALGLPALQRGSRRPSRMASGIRLARRHRAALQEGLRAADWEARAAADRGTRIQGGVAAARAACATPDLVWRRPGTRRGTGNGDSSPGHAARSTNGPVRGPCSLRGSATVPPGRGAVKRPDQGVTDGKLRRRGLGGR